MITDYQEDSLPERLQEFILSRDLTLKEMAAILKISTPTLWRFVNRKLKKHHGRTYYKIKTFLGGKHEEAPHGAGDGRPGYTEPSFDQAVEMGKIVKQKGLFGYIYKGRKFRKSQDLRKADFTVVKGLMQGIKKV